jgi:uncharacterized protein with ParB-like and HNH nuclease domain
MKKILGDAKSVRQLLKGSKYSVDYYQREYKWEAKQLAELVADLTVKFMESYEPGHDRSAVEQYGHYFLGSIIISEKEGQRFIVDGQQRLTTLTLFLIYLHNLQRERAEKVAVDEMIFSERYGRRSFNLDVADRTACMEALFTDEPFESTDQNPSVQNILARYADFDELFPDELGAEALPFFIDWLIENVHLVEITAFSDDDAYTIFETMNDRGLSLTPTDMLKGYLLANITDEKRRLAANTIWKERVNDLNQLGKEEDADCIKAWLRSQYSQTIRERKRGAVPQDFDRIGTEFHRWVREFKEKLALKTGSDFIRFIESDFAFYSRLYRRIRQAAESLTTALPSVFYNAQHNFTLQYPLLLSPVRAGDAEPMVLRKVQIVSDFIDILIARRIWNFRSIDYSTVQYAMFLVMKEIRGLSVDELAASLTERLHAMEDEAPAFGDTFYLHGTNGKQIHRLLSRMTDFVETRSGQASRYLEYSKRGKGGYEVEHIWADHPEQHKDEFDHASEFANYRNRLGGLLLLPKSFNASYGDLSYAKKRPHYLTQNLLARSLHEQCYDHNPGFVRFVAESGLPFQAHPDFKRANIDARQTLYRRLAEQIWSPSRLTTGGSDGH